MYQIEHLEIIFQHIEREGLQETLPDNVSFGQALNEVRKRPSRFRRENIPRREHAKSLRWK